MDVDSKDWYQVLIPVEGSDYDTHYKIFSDMKKWCLSNCDHDWDYPYNKQPNGYWCFTFKKREHAVNFFLVYYNG